MVRAGHLLAASLGWALATTSLGAPQSSEETSAAWVMARGGTAYSVSQHPDLSRGHTSGLALVDFSGRPIVDSDLDGIAALCPIYGIDLSNTDITNAGLKRVAKIRILERFLANRIGIDDIGLAELSGLTKLRNVSLLGTKVTSVGIGRFRNMRELRTLILDETNVDGDAVRRLAVGAPHLEELSLAHTPTSDSGFRKIAMLSRLRILSLTDTKISNMALQSIAKLPRLQTLQLDQTRVTAEGLRYLVRMDTLQVLSVDDTAIGDEAEAYLLQMRRLRILSLVGSRVSAETVEHLRAALAGCDVRTGPPSAL